MIVQFLLIYICLNYILITSTLILDMSEEEIMKLLGKDKHCISYKVQQHNVAHLHFFIFSHGLEYIQK